MVNWKSKYLEMKLKYINAKNKIKGGMNHTQAQETYNAMNLVDLRLPDVVIPCEHDSKVFEIENYDMFKYLKQTEKPDLDRQYDEGANSQTYPSYDNSYVIKIIDKEKYDFDYDNMYAVIVMDRIEKSDKKPTEHELEQIHNDLNSVNIKHGDMSEENILWDEQLQKYQVIDFGDAECDYEEQLKKYQVIDFDSADCDYEEHTTDSFVEEVENEVYCQQKSHFYGLSPRIKAFWFVKLVRASYVLPPKNFTNDERNVLFALFNHYYDTNYTEDESVRFVLENQRITYIDKDGKRRKKIFFTDLLIAFDDEEDRLWFTDAGFDIFENGVRYRDNEVFFR